MNCFENDIYILMVVKDNVASDVLEQRRWFDPDRARLPLEITLAGSSGVGTMIKDQDSIVVFDILDSIAGSVKPITTAFAGTACFPDTDLFYLEPEDPVPFVNLHNKIKSSGIRFYDSPFPFIPHFTIADMKESDITQKNYLLDYDFPKHSFTLDKISVYSLAGFESKLLHESVIDK